MADPAFDRRRVLLGGLSLFGGLSLASSRAYGAVRLLVSQPIAAPAAQRTLLVLQLSGGNDGLNTVVPHGDDAYHRLRPSLAIEPGKVLKIDDYRGLHPSLVRMRELYEKGRLAIVEGAGYPSPVRSHFRSMDIWQAADPRGRSVHEGWVGRLCSCAFPDVRDPNLVVHVGADVPYSLHSAEHPPAAFVSPRSYRWAGSARETDAYEKAGAPGSADASKKESSLEFVRKVLADGQSSSAEIRRAAERYRPSVEYPKSDLAESLRDVAALCHGSLASRVFSIDFGGFDTHTDQVNRHQALMKELDSALGAFLADLERSEEGKNLAVLAFSEFGRRVKENGSKGTDHGVAAPMFVAGARVKGGLYGKHPSLEKLDDGDLEHTTDFRSVYGTLIEKWFEVEHERVLGARYPLLALA